MTRFRTVFCALLVVALFAATGFSAALTDSLKTGKADIKSVGVMTFGPEGILFVGDSMGGAVYAFDTQDRTASTAAAVDVTGIDQKIASMLGTMPDQIMINDLAVNDHAVIPVVYRPRVQTVNNKLMLRSSGWDSDFWDLPNWYKDA